MRRLAAILGLLLAATAAARADNLVSGLSQDEIQITSSYTGTELIVFGAIEKSTNDAQATSRDVVVVLRGPDSDMTVRRKVRVAGVWINKDAMTLFRMPSYYYLASSRPLKELTTEETLARYQLGLAALQPESLSTHTPAKAEPFRLAAIRARERDGLFEEDQSAVEFLSYSLFRVRVPVPASVPRGQYTAEVYLFSNGMVVGAQTTPLYVEQTGVERRLFNFAHNDGVLYGLIAVVMALLIGWLSSVVFRREG
jgi:uncharacterized protein (TIGR02186 family)